MPPITLAHDVPDYHRKTESSNAYLQPVLDVRVSALTATPISRYIVENAYFRPEADISSSRIHRYSTVQLYCGRVTHELASNKVQLPKF